MPTVGRRSFAYTSRGQAAAKKYAKRTGQKLTGNKKKKKKAGGY
jgi:hypothetical protein